MRYRGGTHAGAQARSAHAIGAERAARGRDRAAARARARSAHAIGAERVARAVDGSQRLRSPAHRRAAPCAERRARSARRRTRSAQDALGAGQARRRRRVRSAHATGAERVARGGASSGMLAQPAHAATLGGFCLLAQLLQLTSWCGLRLCHQHLAAGPLYFGGSGFLEVWLKVQVWY